MTRTITFIILAFLALILYLLLQPRVIYEQDSDLMARLKADLYRVDNRSGNYNYYSSNESLTEDKRDIYLCLHDPDTGKYYDYNMLVYVSLHELAHALSPTVDENHTSLEFNNQFNQLQNRARELGIFDPSKPLIMNYCPLRN